MQIVLVLLAFLSIPVCLCYGACQAGNGAFSAADQKSILDYHNFQLRSPIAKGTFTAKGKIMPAATNMRKMIWNCDLEKSAQDHANKCVFAHSKGYSQGSFGENLYISSTTGTPPSISDSGRAAVQSWASEFQLYGWPSVKLTAASLNSGIGHATQMAWWSSLKVGCGVKQCADGPNNRMLVVCQYLQKGNMINSDNYETGKTCSKCGSGFTCETGTGLCVQTAAG